MRALLAGLVLAQLLTPVIAHATGPKAPRRVVTEDNCKRKGLPNEKVCLSKRVTGYVEADGKITPFGGGSSAPNGGFAPADLISAYGLNTSGGAGITVALVEAFHYPNAQADMETYRQQFGLPSCPSFTEISSSGGSVNGISADSGWEGEEMLDIDMVSAICPNCNILIVAAPNDSGGGLFDAANAAAAAGATVVSNSWGGPETDNSLESNYNHPGVLFTASAGDSGFGASYPASSAFVLAVGGTSLQQGGGSRGWTEAVWNGTGSGCSAVITQPSFQTGIPAGCGNRMETDVSAVADPNTGVAVFDSGGGGWGVVGGTSASSPIVASVFALYGLASAGVTFPYQNTTAFNDVTSGSNDLGDGSCTVPFECNGEVGYDGPTGWGTPNGAALSALGTGTGTGNGTGSGSGTGTGDGSGSAGNGSDGSGGTGGGTGTGTGSGGTGTGGAGSGGGTSGGTGTGGSSTGTGGTGGGSGGTGAASGGTGGTGGTGGYGGGAPSGSQPVGAGGYDAGGYPSVGEPGVALGPETSSGCATAAPGSSSPLQGGLGVGLLVGALAVIRSRRRR